MSQFTVAAVQAGSTLFDTGATLKQALAYIGEAAEQSASLVVLPEAYLGGYPKGLDFGITVGSRSSKDGRTSNATSTRRLPFPAQRPMPWPTPRALMG